MSLQKLTLKNFRNHKSSTFTFPLTTVIIGKNTVGKTSVLEAIQFLSLGKSFKAEKDMDVIRTGEDFSRIEAVVLESDGKTNLTVILALKEGGFTKKFMANNVARRQSEFSLHFPSVLFTPEDLEIITDTPSMRRNYVNNVLSMTDKKYKMAVSVYEKALRHRNRMLYLMREGKKFFGEADFEYWDNILINNGGIITQTREDFVNYINAAKKEVFEFEIFYDKSTITPERLLKYYDAERATATTLVGPNRDDFFFLFPNPPVIASEARQSTSTIRHPELASGSQKSISEFGSRGQQRLTIFQMKILETFYIKEKLEVTPTLLLDDIFSELDNDNIHRILDLLPHQQTIITTTHKEFVPKKILDKEDVEIIEL